MHAPPPLSIVDIGIDGHHQTIEALVVDDSFISENILLGRDVLCRSGHRLIIEHDDCWLETAGTIKTGETLTPNEFNDVQFLVK